MKEVEITTIRYAANDGTVFDTEEECIEYEEDLLSRNLFVFNKDCTLIETEDWINEDFVILLAETDEAAQIFYNIYEAEYITPWSNTGYPVKKGIYVNRNKEWFIEKDIVEMLNCIKTIEKSF